jgi:hypothetical protein
MLNKRFEAGHLEDTQFSKTVRSLELAAYVHRRNPRRSWHCTPGEVTEWWNPSARLVDAREDRMKSIHVANALMVAGLLIPGLTMLILASHIPSGGRTLTDPEIVVAPFEIMGIVLILLVGAVLSAKALHRDPALRSWNNGVLLAASISFAAMLTIIAFTFLA